ncbi:VirB3 family type IV secretion system protein (plasmid) [Rhizobium sp. CB3171]|uniref:type IV secretion system protein VirB3 n=1 Tax=unclassified Rhizobium TaxID=2613769 RepID=UPI0024B119AF|nr:MULTISPECIES: VirB3 family type IV secretion system protein [unclassified Rhizobium]MDK4741337.1 VirB3 family type IV secretion system protein [Rhizobium sp. CNPSo 3464]WFU05908.1 VirB3 family type IV secretion system protein [Rhizobium sp. CB3171]
MAQADNDKPHLTPLVIGLTRAPTLWGVPYMAVVIMIGTTTIAWLATNELWALLTAPFAYVVLFTLSTFDARILDVLQVSTRLTPKTPNKTFWGANSYGP